MVTAATAWELADASGGRFRLGLGTQVKAHIERRYATAFDYPGPRLREYILAIRAIFAAFRNEAPLAFDGDFYQLSLLPAMWSPGPINVADPPIDIAAVNPWMLRMAGQVADGVHVHPLTAELGVVRGDTAEHAEHDLGGQRDRGGPVEPISAHPPSQPQGDPTDPAPVAVVLGLFRRSDARAQLVLDRRGVVGGEPGSQQVSALVDFLVGIAGVLSVGGIIRPWRRPIHPTTNPT